MCDINKHENVDIHFNCYSVEKHQIYSVTYLNAEIVDGLVFMVDRQYFLHIVRFAVFVRQYLHGVNQEFGLCGLSTIK